MNKYALIIIAIIWTALMILIGYNIKKTPQCPKSVLVKIITEKEKLIAHIKHYEQFRPIREKENGRYYIGYGHQCLNDEFTERIDSNMADIIIKEDFDYCMEQIKGLKLNENQRLAVASFVFNFGYSYFVKSGLYNLIRKNKPVTSEWLKHCRYNGKVNDGLLQRRVYEAYLYSL